MSRYINMNASGGILSKLTSFKYALYENKMMIVGLIVLFAILAFVYYYYFTAKPSYKANREFTDGSNDGGKQAELMLFYVDWCPHCKTAKPVWDELKSEYQNRTINGYNVIFTEVNCTTETDEIEKMINTYKIEGYPTIKLLKDGQVIEYDAKPNKDTLVQFLNTVL
jgi:thiol-disulfide isomerase/thioredoxin